MESDGMKKVEKSKKRKGKDDTDFPAYSDTLGKKEKCHCKQMSL